MDQSTELNCGTGKLKGKALERVPQMKDIIAKGGEGAQEIRHPWR